MKKVIKFSLDGEDVAKAVKEVRDFQKEVRLRASRAMNALVDMGVSIAQEQIVSMDAVETTELFDSISGYVMLVAGSGNRAVIFTDAPHAIYVEFGTWLARGEDGWWYFDKKQGRRRWTRGKPPRPFMSNTAQRLSDVAEGIFKGAF